VFDFSVRGPVAAVGVRSTERDRAIERAMRAHPAGRALPGGGMGVRPAGVRPAVVRPVVVPPAHPGAVAAPPPARLRLTARGRLVVAVLALAAATGAAAVTGLLPGDPPAAGLHLEGQSSVVVRSGDTLWSIASSVAGDDDVRDVVHRIQRLNGLRDTTLVPGDVLLLP
jgi:nucleoid-associated protein YgaU